MNIEFIKVENSNKIEIDKNEDEIAKLPPLIAVKPSGKIVYAKRSPRVGDVGFIVHSGKPILNEDGFAEQERIVAKRKMSFITQSGSIIDDEQFLFFAKSV